jgi:hypothetical protein
MIVRKVKRIRRALSRGAAAGLTLLAASLPSDANSAQDHREESKLT